MSRLLAALLAAALFLAGCADDAPEDATTDETTDAPADDAATEDDTAAGEETGDAAGETAVAVATTDLGDVLVDGSGRALYLFDNDEENTSNCAGQCVTNWPPLAGPATAGEGVDAALLGTIDREDGTVQVTYAGMPLYHFAADESPGDLNGQGVGGIWWLVAPDGSAVRGSDGS